MFDQNKKSEKKIIFLVYGKTPIIQVSYMENAYHRVFIQFFIRMESYEIVRQEASHIWKLYDKMFWSTRAVRNVKKAVNFAENLKKIKTEYYPV